MKTKTEMYGWNLWHTGGGCMAWGFNLSPDGADGAHVMATEHDRDAAVPVEGTNVLVGYYTPENSDGIYVVATWDEFIDATPAEWAERVKDQGAYAFPPPTYVADEDEVTDGKCEDCGTASAYHGGLCPDCIEKLGK